MPTEFKLPDPGEGIHEAEILKILVSEGDRVEEEQPVMEIETDKAAVEIPAPVAGVVKEIRVSEGDIVQVGDILMVFSEDGEDQDQGGTKDRQPAADKGDDSGQKKEAPDEAQARHPKTEAQEDAAAKKQARPEKERGPEKQQKQQAAKKSGREEETEAQSAEKKTPPEKQPSKAENKAAREGPVPATPATRRLARELKVDLDQVKPSGPAGRVTANDVQAHAEGTEPKPAEKTPSAAKEAGPAAPSEAPAERPALPDFSRWGEVEEISLRSVRRTTAKRMAQSWSQIPHVTHQDAADVTDLEAFRRENKPALESRTGELTLTVFAIKAAVAALKAHPRFNASLNSDAQKIILKKYFHIGVAVDTDRGLLVPVVRRADCKSMLELAAEVYELAERSRQGELAPEDMSGGTFTITNVGPLGGTGFTPIINYPQAAILGLARARLVPVIQGDIDHFEVVPRLMLPLCLAFDHRIADGADAARFMGEIIRLLENPQSLMLSQ